MTKQNFIVKLQSYTTWLKKETGVTEFQYKYQWSTNTIMKYYR